MAGKFLSFGVGLSIAIGFICGAIKLWRLQKEIEESKREEKEELPKTEKREPPKKLRPNYFVAVKISNPEIHENLKKVQNHILERESNLKRNMIELKTLHITLMVMHIGDTETHARALNALRSVHQEYDKEMSDNPLELEFKGLGHFQNRVVFAKLSADDSYERLCNLAKVVKKHFEANTVFSTDKRSTFTPHLTVAKIDFKKKQNRFIKKIDPELYKDYVNQHFGTQIIESIQLLSMTNPKNEEGYYDGDEIYFSSFDPSNDMNSLCELLEVDKKKKDIKDIINSLMKEKLK